MLHFIIYPTLNTLDEYYELFVNKYATTTPQVSRWYKITNYNFKVDFGQGNISNTTKYKIFWGGTIGLTLLSVTGLTSSTSGFLAAFSGYSRGSNLNKMIILNQGGGFNVTQPSEDNLDYDVIVECLNPNRPYFYFTLLRAGSIPDVKVTVSKYE